MEEGRGERARATSRRPTPPAVQERASDHASAWECFADDGLPGRGGRDIRCVGIEAVYTPAGGEPVSWRLIARRPDTIIGLGDTRTPAETATFELRTSEVASLRRDDQLVVDGQTFAVQGEPERRDPDRLVWSLDTRPA